nr:NADH dehydrogenase subunit 6 [Thyrsites atun]
MASIMSLFSVGLVFSVIGVASNPCPHFGALWLVGAAGMGCGVLAGHGGSFLSLVLFLIYLGGMLVVFAYSSALAADPYPEGWEEPYVMFFIGFYVTLTLGACRYYWELWHGYSWVPVEEMHVYSLFRADTEGVALLYAPGSWMLVGAAWVLFITLLVVLELTRGLSRGPVRAV